MPPAPSFGRPATRSAQVGRSVGHALSVPQAEIAALVSRGISNREIAFTLGRSPRTIDVHIVAIFRTLNVRSRGELIVALNRQNDPMAANLQQSNLATKRPASMTSVVDNPFNHLDGFTDARRGLSRYGDHVH
jgi:DNA-binding CsgD family transcriptional regulator